VAKAKDKQLHLSPKSDGNNKRRRTTFVGIEKVYDGELNYMNLRQIKAATPPEKNNK
jgi:hypothetical protein